MNVVTRRLTIEEDGIPGYVAHPVRDEKGPGLLLIHQHSGLTGYLKTAAYKFAQLGYTTVIPNLYHLLGYPAETHIHTGTEIQNRTCDEDFVRVTGQGWQYLVGRSDVDPRVWGVLVIAWGAGLASISWLPHPVCGRSWHTIRRLGMNSRQKYVLAILVTRRGRSNAPPWCYMEDRIGPALYRYRSVCGRASRQTGSHYSGTFSPMGTTVSRPRNPMVTNHISPNSCGRS